MQMKTEKLILEKLCMENITHFFRDNSDRKWQKEKVERWCNNDLIYPLVCLFVLAINYDDSTPWVCRGERYGPANFSYNPSLWYKYIHNQCIFNPINLYVSLNIQKIWAMPRELSIFQQMFPKKLQEDVFNIILIYKILNLWVSFFLCILLHLLCTKTNNRNW